MPAWIENDANAGALAEHRLGAGRGSKHMIMVAAGTGIGGGFILDGKLYHGASGGAGEVGHMQMDPTGRMCGCGRRGCLEAVASGWALSADAADIVVDEPDGLVARISARENEEPDARILDLAAEQGDARGDRGAAACRACSSAPASTNLIDLFNPEVIVIGGSLRKSDIYYKTALEGARRDAYPQHASDVRIVEAELGDDAPAMGAGAGSLGELAESS